MPDSLPERLKALLVERLFLDITPESIDTNTALSEYGIDSFLLLELIVAIEEEFGVAFEPTDIKAEHLKSIASLEQLVLSKQ